MARLRSLTRVTLILTGLLGACAGGGAIYFGDEASALYRRQEVEMAALQGPVPLTIRGNPFPGTDPGALGAVVVAAMTRSPAVAPMRPTTADPGPRAVDYRIVLAFGQPRLGVAGLCAAPETVPPSGEGISAVASFCIGERMLSTIRGRMTEPAQGPEDPRFAAFVSGLALYLLPSANPHRDRSRRDSCTVMPC